MERTLREGLGNLTRTLAAAGIRPLSLRLEAQEGTLRAWVVIRAGNLSLRVKAALGRETFFRVETIETAETAEA